MKVVALYSLFFLLSILLIVLALTEYMQGSLLYANKKELRVEKSKKNYLKNRHKFVPIRTLAMAQKEIDRLLEVEPFLFEDKGIELENNSSKRGLNLAKVTLSNIVKILNHLDEDAILTINTYSENRGSKKYNLELSQQRADVLKKYFRERTSLPLIVAIGYGGAIPFKKEDKTTHKQVEISLKRIK